MAAPTDDLRYSLRFLSGKHQGSEYVLDDPINVGIGRSSDADLMLVEGMVSRNHARIELREGMLVIEDLGSTNGTYVNGERAKSRRLEEGDRILIGTTIVKVVKSRLPAGTRPPPPPSSKDTDDVQTADRNQMAGGLDEVSVPELIEMFGSARQKLILKVNAGDGTVRITIADGKVQDCKNERLPDAPAFKCMLRALGYDKGSFTVRPYRDPGKPAPLDIPIPELLVDGLFKLDEVQVLRQRLPARGEKMVLARPLVAPLHVLDERDLDVLRLAHNHGDVEAVIDNSTETDLETAKRLLSLIDGGYLRRA